jgi:uncharacterized protein (DUF885 family)
MLNRRTVLLATAACALGSVARPLMAQVYRPAAAALNRLFDEFHAQNLARSPETATRLGSDDGSFAAARWRLDDRSAQGKAARKEDVASQLATLRAFDARALDGMDSINYESVLYSLEVEDEANRRFDYGPGGAGTPYVLTHSRLPFQTLAQFLANQHRIETAVDADAYLARLEAVATAIDQETALAKEDHAKRVTPPDFILDKAIAQSTSARGTAPEKQLLITALDRKVREKNLAAGYVTAARDIYSRRILPALDRQIELLQTMRRSATHDAGVWKLPDGDAFYASAIKDATTTRMTPNELHEIGLEIAADVSAQMDVALKAQGFDGGTLGERMRALYADSRFIYPNTDDGKEREIADLNVKLDAVQALLPRFFKTLPEAKAEAQRTPPETEAVAAPGSYRAASLDGSRPPVFYLNLRDTAEMPLWSAMTIAFHEAIPGHHLQVSLQQEAGELPLIRRAMGFSAYAEGWALYAEKLVDEMGVYEGDPFGRIGYLRSALFRAGRLVVDTGIHAKRWSREQGISWLVDAGAGFPSVLETEVERYCTGPAQACSYMVGRLFIDRLREKARTQLGARFDIGEFHDAVLRSGAMPLDTLEKVVDAHIAARRA